MPWRQRLYVALGDSLGCRLPAGGTELRDTAYPALVASRREAAGAELEVENLGCSGETTTSLIEGGSRTFEEGSLEQAEAVLAERAGEVALVTIDIGGNDLLRCVRGGASIDTARDRGRADGGEEPPDDPSAAAHGCWCRRPGARARLLQPVGWAVKAKALIRP